MNEIVVQAIDSINKLLGLPLWELLHFVKERLATVPDLLNQLLLEQNVSRNEWNRLFYRQLRRFMNSNKSLLARFWMDAYDDICCVLNKANPGENRERKWHIFLKRMDFEEKLEQREVDHQQIVKEEKSLSELISVHRQFFRGYFRKCVDFHSKIEIPGLIENLVEFSCHLEEKEYRQKITKLIEIPLDYSNRSMTNVDVTLTSTENSSEETNIHISNFLPSQSVNINIGDQIETIENALGSNRWMVILGDPGSAKTTLLRWITRMFAEVADRGETTVNFEGYNHLPLRIPILIRMGEFASWLNQHHKGTLCDYI